VRKSCAEQTPVISSVCSQTSRESDFTAIYLDFLKDSAKAVRNSSFEHLGPFIASLKGLNIHEHLIEAFVKMSDNSSKEV
jgi:serine/threonine-protein phosphatase 4 regulatory subunit 1